jgi:hypothetical protein
MFLSKIFTLCCGCQRNSGGANSGYFAEAVGPNNYTTVGSLPISQYSLGLTVIVQFTATNTGPSTININGIGNVPLKKNGGTSDLQSTDIIQGGIYELVYDGTNFQIVINSAL